MMESGAATTLSSDKQRLVALWLLKTALVLILRDAHHPATGGPADQSRIEEARAYLRTLVYEGIPPVGTVVRIGGIDAANRQPHPFDPSCVPSDQLPRVNVQLLFRIGHLASHVLVPSFLGLHLFRRGLFDENWLAIIWPSQASDVSWPPVKLFREGDYFAFHRWWRSVSPPRGEFRVPDGRSSKHLPLQPAYSRSPPHAHRDRPIVCREM